MRERGRDKKKYIKMVEKKRKRVGGVGIGARDKVKER